jgi:hypothetical protein
MYNMADMIPLNISFFVAVASAWRVSSLGKILAKIFWMFFAEHSTTADEHPGTEVR